MLVLEFYFNDVAVVVDDSVARGDKVEVPDLTIVISDASFINAAFQNGSVLKTNISYHASVAVIFNDTVNNSSVNSRVFVHFLHNGFTARR